MCYGKPDEILADISQARPLQPNANGHTPMADFEHFCAYPGCDPVVVSPEAYPWAKLAYISARLPKVIDATYLMLATLARAPFSRENWVN